MLGVLKNPDLKLLSSLSAILSNSLNLWFKGPIHPLVNVSNSGTKLLLIEPKSLSISLQIGSSLQSDTFEDGLGFLMTLLLISFFFGTKTNGWP